MVIIIQTFFVITTTQVDNENIFNEKGSQMQHNNIHKTEHYKTEQKEEEWLGFLPDTENNLKKIIKKSEMLDYLPLAQNGFSHSTSL